MCQTSGAHEAYGELTVQQVMAEPIVRDLMRADHVDPAAFEALLRSVAAHAPRPRCRAPSAATRC